MTKRLAVALTLVIAWGSLALPATLAAATPQPVTVEVPVVLPDAVNLAGKGFVPIVIVSTDEVDATEIDLDTLVVGGDTPAGRWDDGSVMATTTDINANGRDDLVVHVDKESLVGTGDLDARTTALAVSGTLPDGDTVLGTATVQPEITLEIKFEEELRVRGTDRTLRSQRGRSLQTVREVLERHGGGTLDPMVDERTTLRLERLSVEAVRAGEQRLPDMASWYRVTLPAEAGVDAAVADLEALGEIAFAYPAPEPAPLPQVVTDTPDFTHLQTYFGPAPQGIDADFSREDPRLRGAGIKIVDLEYNWNPFHEDLLLDVEPEPDTSNLAPAANVSCSYTSPWESCSVLNSGSDPASSNPSSNRWGTWPNGGAHWIQLTWSQPQEVAVSDIYWFQDSADGSNSGVKRPAEWSIQYWDGQAWQDVVNPSGYGTALNQYNRTTFDAVTTTQLRANVQTRSDAIGVGALQWKVYTEPPPDLPEPGPWTTDVGDGQFVRINTFGDDHGTAVFGQLVALDNDYGVTGGVPDADMYGISPVRQFASGATSWQPGPALAYLAGRTDEDGSPWMKPGDAVILEQQTSSPLGGTRYAPLEWIPSVFDAIVVLTNMGVNVVSTGGNGNTDSDDPMYTRGGIAWFDPDVQHSGSVLVGAGGSGQTSSNARERLGFSNYGTRFDLQAWGQHIATTGYCSLYCVPGNHNIRYSQTFSGTSGAGPIVTAAVVALQSYIMATGQEPWSAQEIADVLKATGTPQGPNTAHQHIGPLPDLRAALIAIEVDPPATTAELSPAPTGGWYADPTVTLTADDGWGSGVAVTEYRLDGGPWTTYDGPFQVTGDGEYVLEYRSVDNNGNVEDTNTLAFGVDTTAPEISINTPSDGSVFLIDEEAEVDFACTDALSGVAECDGSLPLGSPLPTSTAGFHDFSVTASDHAGNSAEEQSTYQVVWPFEGFFPPLGAPGSVTTAGSTVPVHFGLGGDRGLDVLEPGYPTSTQVDCLTGEALGEEVPTQSAVGLRYTEEDRYIYPWRTLASWSGTCRTLTVRLVDGSVHEADLVFQ